VSVTCIFVSSNTGDVTEIVHSLYHFLQGNEWTTVSDAKVTVGADTVAAASAASKVEEEAGRIGSDRIGCSGSALS